MEQKKHIYMAIDLKSFYASVECISRQLDPLTTNLVVADTGKTEKTICLAVTPSLKKYGISGRARLFEVVQTVKEINAKRRKAAPGHQFVGESYDEHELTTHPELAMTYIAAPPRMAFYLEQSTQIYDIYLKYISAEDIHVYSIDEVFLDVTGYLKAYQTTPRQLAKRIITDILNTTGITAAAGIGTNLYLCKIAMDIVAKHIPADSDGIPSFYSIGLDITKERLQMEKLRHKAEKDTLTGVYNRETMKQQLQSYLIENPKTVNALIMVDTDNFKQINDTHGHITGDLVLSEMAAGMKRNVRKDDLVGRIGGDEFTIFLKNISSATTAMDKAEELLAMFQQLFSNEKKPIAVTCSMGIAMYPRDGESFQELYECADKALYQAKQRGKNGCCMYDDSLLQNQEYLQNSSLGAAIDSEQNYAESQDNLARYVFRILYHYEHLDEAVNLVLEIVGKQFDVSRSYIFENTRDGSHGFNTYEWCNEGISSEMKQLQNVNYKELGDYEALFQEDHIFYCRDIQSLSPTLVELFESQGIHSTLQCAFYDNGIFRGFIGFDECTGSRFWTREEVSSLTLISQILATFLKLNRMEAETPVKE